MIHNFTCSSILWIDMSKLKLEYIYNQKFLWLIWCFHSNVDYSIMTLHVVMKSSNNSIQSTLLKSCCIKQLGYHNEQVHTYVTEIVWLSHVQPCLHRPAYYTRQVALGGGGGAEVSCPNIFSISCPKIQGFAQILLVFPELAIWRKKWNNFGGREAAAP